MLPTTQSGYWKGLGTCDELLCLFYILQSALGSRQKARFVQIDFNAAFDTVNHQGILYKLCSVGIGGSVFFVLTVSIKPITTRYGGWLCLVNVVSAVPQGSVLGSLFFLLHTSEFLSIL